LAANNADYIENNSYFPQITLKTIAISRVLISNANTNT